MTRKLNFFGAHKRHLVDLDRKHKDDDWYLIITAPDGSVVADGWIRDSADWEFSQVKHHAFSQIK